MSFNLRDMLLSSANTDIRCYSCTTMDADELLQDVQDPNWRRWLENVRYVPHTEDCNDPFLVGHKLDLFDWLCNATQIILFAMSKTVDLLFHLSSNVLRSQRFWHLFFHMFTYSLFRVISRAWCMLDFEKLVSKF